MSYQSLNVNPKSTQIINEILEAFNFKNLYSFYERLINDKFEEVWGVDDEDDEYGSSGYTDITIDLVDEGLISSDIVYKLNQKNIDFINLHILNASLYITRYILSTEFNLTVEFIFDAKTENEALVEFEIEMNSLGVANKVTMHFDDENANNQQITLIALKHF